MLSVGAIAAVVLYRFPPKEYGFYPRCPIYAWTGLLCPGCGMTRALAALVHGHLGEALRWNPMVLLVIAALLAWIITAYRGTPIFWAKMRGPLMTALLLAVAVFTVVRNLR